MNVGKLIGKGVMSVRHGWNRHGQIITVIVASVSAVMAVAEAIKASKRAEEIRETKEDKLDVIDQKLESEEITQEEYDSEKRAIQVDAAKDYVFCYGKSAAFLALSLGANAVGYKMSLAKQATLLGMYKLSESKKDEIQAKLKEVMGEKQYDKLMNKVETGIAADHIKATPMPEEIRRRELPVGENELAGSDLTMMDYPCWDAWSGRFFSSTRPKIERALLVASHELSRRGENFVSMNFIYDELGMECSEGGSENGFNTKDLIDGEIPVSWSSVNDENYGPVLVVSLKPHIDNRDW